KDTHVINCLKQTVSELQHKLFAHQDTISVLTQQKVAQIKLYKTREDKDIEKVIDLENKVKVLDNIVYKTGQSNMLNNKCRTSFVKPGYLKKAKQAIPRLEYFYADHMNAILGVYTELDEVTNLQCDYLELLQKCECLETELSKSTKISKSFESVQKHAINLELELQQCKSTTFSNSFIRNDFSKSTSVSKNNVSNDFSKPVPAQTLPVKKKPCLKNTNMLAPGMYKIRTAHTQATTSKLPQDSKKTNISVSFSTDVIPTTSVSRPQLKSNPKGDRVLRSNSSGKKLEVERPRRNVKFSKNKMPVTACTANLNAKTVNVKFVSAMCAKSVMINKHDSRVPKYVAKPLKKTVASDTIKKPRNNE
nr:hypothetical protein [Tanacetum cinerariifolium]